MTELSHSMRPRKCEKGYENFFVMHKFRLNDSIIFDHIVHVKNIFNIFSTIEYWIQEKFVTSIYFKQENQSFESFFKLTKITTETNNRI